MSVVVIGMEMPENCGKCPFLIEEDIDFDVCRQCGAGKNGYIYEKDIDGFPSDCPLVAFPDKHGRVIDEDDVINAIHERLHELQTHKEFIKKRGDIDLLGILPYIAKIHAIIEAEDG